VIDELDHTLPDVLHLVALTHRRTGVNDRDDQEWPTILLPAGLGRRKTYYGVEFILFGVIDLVVREFDFDFHRVFPCLSIRAMAPKEHRFTNPTSLLCDVMTR
jgi:hypothetical protein